MTENNLYLFCQSSNEGGSPYVDSYSSKINSRENKSNNRTTI